LGDDYYSVVKKLKNDSNYSYLGFDDELTNKILDLKNNVLLIIEFGEGPFKSRRGRYGELAVVNGDRYDIKDWNLKIDGKLNPKNQAYSNTDVYFQASTRGGRKMDSILKGKAQFKTNAANTSIVALTASQRLMNQANQTSDPNSKAVLACAAGVSALFSGGAAIMSKITNPKADIRYWSLLPEHIVIYPLFIPQGKHKISIEFNNNRYTNSDQRCGYEFDINVQRDKDNIIFKRILNYQVSVKPYIHPLGVTKLGEGGGMSFGTFSRLVDKGMSFDRVEQLFGIPLKKNKDYWVGRFGIISLISQIALIMYIF